jgi:exo-1,4-beta-D-glucosaminidase
LQLIYDYYNKSVFAVNETRKDADNQYAIITLLDFDSKVVLRKEINFKVRSNTSEQILQLDSLDTGAFLDLKMYDRKGHLINQNFYWLSAKPDVFDWAKTTWAHTPLKEFADFSELGSLPAAEIKSSVTLLQLADQIELKLDLKNQSDKTAFFINLTLLDKSDNQMFPVFWDDNYISILPGESRQIRCLIPESSLKSERMSILVSGWNFEKKRLEIKY